MNRLTNQKLSAFAASFALLATVAKADTTNLLYSTGFDASQGYLAADINGQNGWTTYQPAAGSGYANVTFGAPAGFSGTGAFQLNSGINGNESPRYAWPAGYGATFSSVGAYGILANNSMYLPSGQTTSAARVGLVTYDSTGAKILGGYYVQASTSAVYLLGYYNNAGTLGNYAFNTGATLATDQWTDFTTFWNGQNGRLTVSWGANSFYVDGAGAGSIADETDFYANRNGSAIAATSYYDNLSIGAVIPEPSSFALGLTGLAIGGWLMRNRRPTQS